MSKVALITGITGQDGAYLAEFLLKKGYEVHGIKRRSSLFNTDRIDHLYQDPHEDGVKLTLHYGDLTDSTNLIRLVQEIQPDEIYNLGAMSHVKVSFDSPEYVANVDGIGTLRILEAVRILGLQKKTKIYQASTSELYGGMPENKNERGFYDENSPFYPRSPYAVAKLYAYWITVNYREAYDMFACNGILFNHESPRRGETFVTRKITRALARIKLGIQECLYLGNIDAKRDWGHAKDYVEAMWRILQQDTAEDYVIATGITTKGDADKIYQVVTNLLANARAHTPAGTAINVSVVKDGADSLVTIADNGPGLSAEDQARIFERFYRVDASRQRNSKDGSGLGLSIVDAVMRAHGGEVTVASELGKGAAFTLRFKS